MPTTSAASASEGAGQRGCARPRLRCARTEGGQRQLCVNDDVGELLWVQRSACGDSLSASRIAAQALYRRLHGPLRRLQTPQRLLERARRVCSAAAQLALHRRQQARLRAHARR